ncbi:MAG: hypothetical protein LBK53_00650 [Heliobacteriaceae bacterium]|jgi:hypothetical protein|nr:hypothetical protein [Heliobacteriaceae bacterium]
MIPAITSKIYSTLGSDSSLIPLAIKDVANSLGMTAGSCITGSKLEGKDRFIDEFGAGAIWLLGVPVCKKVLDLILFKPLGLDPKIDIRNFKNKDILKTAVEKAPEHLQKGFKKAVSKEKLVKSLNIGKFGIATALTILSYNVLTNFRHKHTRESAKKQALAEYQNRTNINDFMAPAHSMETFFKGGKPSFTGLQDFMFNAVKNTMVVDAAITGQRLGKSETPQELMGYTIKEGGFWLFMYLIQKPVRQYFEKKAEAKHGKSITLDSKVIESTELKNYFKNPNIKEQLKLFSGLDTDVKMYNFIHEAPGNIVVEMAKKSGIIKVIEKGEGKGKIDTRAYIDLKEVKGVKDSLAKLYEQYSGEMSKGVKPEEFFAQVRKLKRTAALKNIGASIAALGILVPGIMVAIRYLKKGNKDFQIKKQAEKELALQGKI